MIGPKDQSLSADRIENAWFDINYWQQCDCVIGEARGRYVTWFIQPNIKMDDNADLNQNKIPSKWVLRHYYRGGMIAKITTDQFLYCGVESTRGFKEVKLLLSMKELGLPVPQAIGARIRRKGLFYRADLLMEKIEANDLVATLKTELISNELWARIGRVVAQFHHQGIFHADLNAHNILMDKDYKIWLIDFDRCERRAISTSWQQKNIQRLKRSFLKEKTLYPSFNFNEENWNSLIQGYQSIK